MALEMKLTAKHFVKNENSVGCFKLFLLPFFSFFKASIISELEDFSITSLGNCFGKVQSILEACFGCEEFENEKKKEQKKN